MTLPQLEGELRRLQSQVPEAENKVRRGKSRLESSVADLNSEIKKQEMKSQEEASNWSRTPFPCPCCRYVCSLSPLASLLSSDLSDPPSGLPSSTAFQVTLPISRSVSRRLIILFRTRTLPQMKQTLQTTVAQ
jgi:hypothetical protein